MVQLRSTTKTVEINRFMVSLGDTNQMLEKLEGSGAFDVKYGSILGEVLLYNEIKKSRLYTLNSKFDLSGKNIVCLNV